MPIYAGLDVSDKATHFDRAAIHIPAQLITVRTTMLNQLHDLLKLVGLQLGSARSSGKRTERLAALYSQHPVLELCPLL